MQVKTKPRKPHLFGQLSQGLTFKLPGQEFVIMKSGIAKNQDGAIYSNAVRLDNGNLHRYAETTEIEPINGTFVEE